MLNEYDLRDWICTDKSIKLHDVKRNSVVSTAVAPNKPFFFQRIDGMYSICEEQNGDVFHIAAWTEVHPWVKKKGK